MRKYYILLIAFAVAFAGLIGCSDSNEPKSNLETSTLTYNGYTYKTVKIGNQWWLAENLRTTQYNDGTNIPNITNATQWETTQSGAYCTYDNDNQNIAKYGCLYNYYAVETGKLAPEGWRVATTDDYEALIAFCGGADAASKKLSSKTNWSGTDDYGFSAIPAGSRTFKQGSYVFEGVEYYTRFLTSTTASTPLGFTIIEGTSTLDQYQSAIGASVRLIKE